MLAPVTPPEAVRDLFLSMGLGAWLCAGYTLLRAVLGSARWAVFTCDALFAFGALVAWRAAAVSIFYAGVPRWYTPVSYTHLGRQAGLHHPRKAGRHPRGRGHAHLHQPADAFRRGAARHWAPPFGAGRAGLLRRRAQSRAPQYQYGPHCRPCLLYTSRCV